jgi:protease secretion system outer membrane protein
MKPSFSAALALGALLMAPLAASALDLVQAYEAARQNDPTFRAAYFDNESGKEYRVIGRAALLPQVSANYNASNNVTDITQGAATVHPKYTSRVAVVQLRQPVLSLDGIARYKQGVAQSGYSAAVFDLQQQDLILRLSSAYVDALFADEQLLLARAQRDTLVEQRNVNDRLFEKGEGTRTDMLETQAKLDLAEAQLVEATDNQTNARTVLAAIVGMEVTSLGRLKAHFPVLPLPGGGLEYWNRQALQNNPDVRSQVQAIEAARQEVNKNRAGHAPRVDFVASYSKNTADSITTINQESTVRSIGVQISVPLYSGGAVSATTRQAAAGLEKARADLDGKSSKALTEVRKQYAIVTSSVAHINALVKAENSGQLLMLATEKSIAGGVRINLDLLNAQQQLFSTKRDLAQARYNYLLGILRLRAAAGLLDVGDVRTIAGYFE